ncbi:hypothetical protein AU511_00205 [Lonsdalea iberica]|uniref:Uncharacterized protein n=1 Tax=Lonsdalea iberica TaxID=1082703 RepID=A0A1X3S266_9GAMM|nr:hypothetical protein AU511_00205 [Lonsdalea iberica]
MKEGQPARESCVALRERQCWAESEKRGYEGAIAATARRGERDSRNEQRVINPITSQQAAGCAVWPLNGNGKN